MKKKFIKDDEVFLEIEDDIRSGKIHAETIQLNQAMSIFEENLEEIEDALTENLSDDIEKEEQHMLHVHSLLDSENEIQMDLYAELQKYSFNQLFSGVIKTIKRIQATRAAKHSPTPRAGVTQAMIDRAKEYPLTELFVGTLKKSGAIHIGKCPFHNEKSGSFVVKNNRFTCYGCHVYGDTIDFYMMLHHTDFNTAVRELSK